MGFFPLVALIASAFISIYLLIAFRSRSQNEYKNISLTALAYSIPQIAVLLYLFSASKLEIGLGYCTGLLVTKLAFSPGVAMLFSKSPGTSQIARSSYLIHLGITAFAILPLALSAPTMTRLAALVCALGAGAWITLLIRNRKRLFSNLNPVASTTSSLTVYRARVTFVCLFGVAALTTLAKFNFNLSESTFHQGVLLGILICMPEIITSLLRNPRSGVETLRSISLESAALFGLAAAPIILLTQNDFSIAGPHTYRFVWMAIGFLSTSLMLRNRLRWMEGLAMIGLFLSFFYFVFITKPENLDREFQFFMTACFPILLIILVGFFIKDMLLAIEDTPPRDL